MFKVTTSGLPACTQPPTFSRKRHACGVLKRHNFRVHVSLGSAETLVRRGGIINHHSIAYPLSNISAKNYRNRLMWVESIVCNISVVFLRHSVQWIPIWINSCMVPLSPRIGIQPGHMIITHDKACKYADTFSSVPWPVNSTLCRESPLISNVTASLYLIGCRGKNENLTSTDCCGARTQASKLWTSQTLGWYRHSMLQTDTHTHAQLSPINNYYFWFLPAFFPKLIKVRSGPQGRTFSQAGRPCYQPTNSIKTLTQSSYQLTTTITNFC